MEKPARVHRWWISCDESGIGGAQYYGFGTLWMLDDRRGDFAQLIRDVMTATRFNAGNEFKWNRINPMALNFYLALVDAFFSTKWLFFHCVVYNRHVVDLPPYDDDPDLRFRKRLTEFLSNKISRCVRNHPEREQAFRIWADPIPSRYRKAHEALHVIANNAINKALGKRPVDTVQEHDSKSAPSIQLCDVLLGAVMSSFQGQVTAPAKLAVRARIAEWLGWPDLCADTLPNAIKFNVWYFQDPTKREFRNTRSVK